MLLDTIAVRPARSLQAAAAAAYENAFDRTGTANIEDFLPPPWEPAYPAVLAHLLRVELRLQSAVGRRRCLDDYRHLYPVGLDDAERFAAAAQEEYQMRIGAEEPVQSSDYQSRYGADASAWLDGETQKLISLPVADTRMLTPIPSQSVFETPLRTSISMFTPQMPYAGQQFLHFQLIRELGRGKFGRVFLAHQKQLADRPVALKVTAETDREPQLLATLQHTNIVPIYAVYHDGPLQAICMPYFGSVTLSQVIDHLAREPRQLPRTGRGMLSTLFDTRLKSSAPTKDEHQPAPAPIGEPPALAALGKLSQVNAALWIAARLADGLAHAHERGILHCDLKPANVLIADDGQPMLLDFNVAADRKTVADWRRTALGGTLPYMAPEYLSLIHNDNGELTPRCDLFSLGVVLYEMLTGCHPYPLSDDDVVSPVGDYLAAHSKLPEPPSKRNPEITPAVDAIVCKLLDPDPRRRYSDAAHAREDLERQLAFRPLLHARDSSPRERVRKWRRRNPRLTTGLAVALSALVFLLLPATVLAVRSNQIAARRHEVARSDAIIGHQNAIRELKTAQVLLSSRSLDPALIAEGFKRALAVLDEYGLETDASWALRSRVQLLSAEQQAVLRQEMGGTLLMLARVELARKPAGDQDAAAAAWKWNRLAEDCYLEEERPRLLARQREALATVLPKEVTPIPASAAAAPIDAFHDGYELAMSGEPTKALLKLIPFTDARPDHFLAWYVRGICHDAVGQFPDAAGAFTVCTTLWPDFAWSYFNRGVARLRQSKATLAEADFTRALDRKPNWTDALINRAIARESLKNYDGADADLTAALDREDAPTRAYFLRSKVRMANGDKRAAEMDASEGRKQEPRDTISWITRGYWKHTADPKGAIADYDAALALNPRSADAMKNKAIVLADSLNRTADAIKLMDELLDLYPTHTEARAGRAVYLSRVGDSKRAIADANVVLKEEPTPFRLYQMAGMYAQLSKKDPTGAARQQALQHAAKAFRTGFDNLNLIAQDPDMDPIRQDPEFKDLVQHAQKLQTTVK